MKCSTGIGTLSQDKQLYKTVDSENFYITTVKMSGVDIPAVGSEYILADLEGRVQLQYYLRSETTEDNKLFTFMQIMTVHSVDDDTPETNRIQIGGCIAKTKGLLIKNKIGLEILPFIIKYKSYDGNFNVAHCVAKGAKARELSKIKKGDIVEITGKFKKEHNALEVLVEEVDFYKAFPALESKKIS